MARITKKSINELIDIYKRNSGDTVLKLSDPQDDTRVVMEIVLKTSLTISEKGIFVDRVVIPCFDANGDFMPQYLDPLFMITLLQMTTNVPVIEDTIPITDDAGNETGKSTIINIEKTYELCRAINLVKNATDIKYQALISELKQMVADKLDYVKDVNMHKTSGALTMLKPVLDALQNVGSNSNVMKELETALNSLPDITNSSEESV